MLNGLVWPFLSFMGIPEIYEFTMVLTNVLLYTRLTLILSVHATTCTITGWFPCLDIAVDSTKS